MRSWAERAACRGFPIEVFYPPPGPSAVEALAVCRRCPVREECLRHALTFPERFGVWGGKTARARMVLLREAGKVALCHKAR